MLHVPHQLRCPPPPYPARKPLACFSFLRNPAFAECLLPTLPLLTAALLPLPTLQSPALQPLKDFQCALTW